MKKILSLIFPFLLLLTTPSRSQNKTTQDTTLGFSICLHLGISEFSLPGLNQVLSANGLVPIFDRTLLQEGAEFDLERVTPETKILGGFNFSYSALNNTNQNMEVIAQAFQFVYMFKYLLIHNNRNSLYSSIGYGWILYKLNYFNSAEHPGTFQGAVDTLQGERSLESPTLALIRLGLNYDWAADKRHDLFFGLYAYYDIGLTQRSWELGDGSALNDTPKSTANCFSTGITMTFQ